VSSPDLDQLPGFRRRFRVTPGEGVVRSEVEDDFHCMGVLLHHEDGVATLLEPVMQRAPWNTCPGAPDQLKATFTGKRLAEFPRCGQKTANCTHLYDLALLAAAHADDKDVLVYDVLVSDAIDGERHAELRRNGETLLRWSDRDFLLTAPAELAGTALTALTPWIEAQEPALREAAKVLRWASMIAHGRSIPLEQQSDATRMPPNCYTFQPERAVRAHRVGESKDFSTGPLVPLEETVTGL